MKKLIISALCGLCLMGAFVTTQASGEDQPEPVAISRHILVVSA